MRKPGELLDSLEKAYDRILFRFEGAWDIASEAMSDLLWRVIEGLGSLIGVSIVRGVDGLIRKNRKPRGKVFSFFRKFLGVLVIGAAWVIVQALITAFGLVGNLFGLRRGRVYLVRENLVSWLPLLVLGAIVPLFGIGEYATGQWVLFFSYSIIVLGLNVLVGITGQITLGHAAFVVIGGFVTAYLEKNGFYGFPVFPSLAVLAGAGAAAVLGTFLGFPGARVKGPYLGLITLCLMIVLQPILRSKYLYGFSGGPDGISFDVPKAPAFLPFVTDRAWLYYHAFSFFVLMFIAAHVLIRRTKLGRALASIHESEEKSGVLGINVPFYKTMAFTMSAFYAGIGGGLISLHLGFVSADSVDPNESFHYLAALMIGGRGGFLGSVAAGAFLTYQTFITSWLSHWVRHGDQLLWAVFGTLLVVVMTVAPRGIVGELSHWLYKSRFRLPQRRDHRRSPFPDFDLEEEAIAIGPIPDAMAQPRNEAAPPPGGPA